MILRRRYRFLGIVQGVGFRPFVYRLATANDLSGWVQNRHDGVLVEVEGPAEKVNRFAELVREDLPPLARLSHWESETVETQRDKSFRVIPSTNQGEGTVNITPDAATCPECLRELFDPKDRRFRYPFINCTNCGPRLTIINNIPYDRKFTSMSCFPLCDDCRREYEDPGNRRFHAEPNSCPSCGPILTFLDANGFESTAADPLGETLSRLKSGQILAIKGLGGFHLAVDATNDDAIRRLRHRKHREEKPLAIMVKDTANAMILSEIGAAEETLLNSPERPIVLVKKRSAAAVSPAVAPGMIHFGIMLPYTPLHHLLLEKDFAALVMTSANQTDEPICIGNREAVERLAGIADGFLIHNRDILVRCDDSIAAASDDLIRITRRSRGFAPGPVNLNQAHPPVLALGAHLKSTICILKGNTAFLSPHIGDLETPQARDFFDASIPLLERITECRPDTVACDLHPDFYSSRAAKERGGSLVSVQHHHAHIVSCMAENGWSGNVIGLAMDGTGYGADGQIWGGEFFIADEKSFRRFGHIAYFPLPGGEKSIREPWRIAVSLLRQAYPDSWAPLADHLKIIPPPFNADIMDRLMSGGMPFPMCSSLGRIFDGISALLGVRNRVSFEGQAAMELENYAAACSTGSLPYRISQANGIWQLDFSELVKAMVDGLLSGRDRRDLASSFHHSVIESLSDMAEIIGKETGIQRLALSGGCFQNHILLEGCLRRLRTRRFSVISHQRVPCNDGGISLGQAVCAAARMEHPYESSSYST